MPQNKKGFTLIELLIVIVIIGVLALAMIPTIIEGPKKARDAARLVSMNQIKTAYIKYIVIDGNTPPFDISQEVSTTNADDILADIISIFPENYTYIKSDNFKIAKSAYAETIGTPGKNGHFGITPPMIPENATDDSNASFMIFTEVEHKTGNITCSNINSIKSIIRSGGSLNNKWYATLPLTAENNDNDCYAIKIKINPENASSANKETTTNLACPIENSHYPSTIAQSIGRTFAQKDCLNNSYNLNQNCSDSEYWEAYRDGYNYVWDNNNCENFGNNSDCPNPNELDSIFHTEVWKMDLHTDCPYGIPHPRPECYDGEGYDDPNYETKYNQYWASWNCADNAQ